MAQVTPLLASLQGGVAEQSIKCREASADSKAGVVFRMRTKGKPPRLRQVRWLRDIFLMTQPPLLAVMQGGEYARFQFIHTFYHRRYRALLCHQVRQILFALDADEFENVGVQHQMKFLRGAGPRFCVGLGIVDCGLHLEVSKIRTPKALCDAKRFGRRMALLSVKPSLVV